MANRWPVVAADTDGETVAKDLTRYFSVAGGLRAEATINTEAAWKARANYTIGSLTVYVSAHSGGTNPVITLMVAGSAVNMDVTPTGTGQFITADADVSISSGDLVETRLVTTSATGDTTITRISYELVSASAPPVISGLEGSSTQGSGTTTYQPIGGGISNLTEETRTGVKIINAAANPTFSKLTVVLGINSAGDADGSLKFRKTDSGDLNQVVTITASTVGRFEDASNTDVVTSGDLHNYVIVNGGGGGYRTSHISMLGASYAARRLMNTAGGSDMTVNTGSTYFIAVEGGGILSASNTEVEVAAPMPAGVMTSLFAHQRIGVGANVRCEIHLMLNGVATLMTAALVGSSQHTVEDTTHDITIADGDTVSFRLVGSLGTSNRVTIVSAEFEQAAVGGLSIPIAMHHYKQMMGVN